jgi:hypothetical protein
MEIITFVGLHDVLKTHKSDEMIRHPTMRQQKAEAGATLIGQTHEKTEFTHCTLPRHQ